MKKNIINPLFNKIYMGFLVKFNENQSDRWKVFFEFLKEIYEEGNFFLIPIENGGYCVATNPFSKNAINELNLFFGDQLDENIVFLTDDMDVFKQITSFSDIANIVASKYWPGNMILHLPRKDESKIQVSGIEIPEELYSSFEEIQVLLCGKQFVDKEVFNWLNKQGYPRLLIAFYPNFDSFLNVHDPQEMIQSFGPHVIKIGFDAGQVQEGNKRDLKPLTRIKCDKEGNIELVQEGIVSGEEIQDFLQE